MSKEQKGSHWRALVHASLLSSLLCLDLRPSFPLGCRDSRTCGGRELASAASTCPDLPTMPLNASIARSNFARSAFICSTTALRSAIRFRFPQRGRFDCLRNPDTGMSSSNEPRTNGTARRQLRKVVYDRSVPLRSCKELPSPIARSLQDR